MRQFAALAISACLFLLAFHVKSQNIFNGEGVNFVGQINGYSQPTNLSSDYRVLTYRRVSVASGTPTDGRGQWTTTVNVQSSGGNVTPLNMSGGGGSGFLFTSGPSGNQYANKWAFGGVGQAAINGINGATYQGSTDMGINMSTAGYYTFNMQDNGYASNSYFVGYTSSAPVSVTHNTGTQQTLLYNGLNIGITTSATPSSENVYVRYRIGTNDFTTGTTVIQASGSGTSWNAFIPMQTASTVVYYYVFTSTRTLSQLQADSEFNRSLAAIQYVDNSGSNYSFTFPTNPIIVSSSGGTVSATYASLTLAGGAFAAINAGTHTGTINIGINSSVTTETGANVLNASGTGSASYSSILIQPNFTASISGSAGTALINLTGADNVTIDGRIGGTGSTKSLTFSNTSTGGNTIRFVSDATANIIRYCIIQGVTTTTSSGVILFSTGTTTGNDNNTIEYCDIRDGATTPVNLIYSAGTSTAVDNSGNIISNNNIFNFFSAGSSTNGIFISSNSSAWTISNNSIYQTATRTYTTGSNHAAIQIAGSGNGYVVSGNYIGGTAPLCGSTAWTMAGSVASRFRGISLAVGTTTASSVQGNTIANFNTLTTSGASSAPGVFAAIYVSAGSANIGTVTGNTIGSATGTGNITSQANSAGAITYGIVVSGTTISIENNTIGSISATTSTTTPVGHGVIGISSQGTVNLTIANNSIGSTSTSNSISSSSPTSGSSPIKGIEVITSATSFQVNNNTIANLTSTIGGTTPSAATVGIDVSVGSGSILGNTIFNLSNASAVNGTGSSASLLGIRYTGAVTGMTISENTIHSLNQTNTTATTNTVGIHYGGATTGTNTISHNFIHSLSTSSAASARIYGLSVSSGLSSINNNMIRLGYNSAGTSLSVAYEIHGIIETTGTNNYFHNSVYIGGNVTGTSAINTFAFNSATTVNTRVFANNIFMNARSNATTGGGHFAIQVGGTGTNPTGLTSNYNILFATGTGGAIGRYSSTTHTTLSSWQTATGQDLNSINADPAFLNPTGTSSTVDLHLDSTGTPAEQSGTSSYTTADDYDGQTRSGLTPVDIGADAGNFVAIDLSAPSITFTPLTSPTCFTGSITILATITDATGVPTTGSQVPRVYYKVGAGAYSSAAGTLVTGSGTNGEWTFTIPGVSPSTPTTVSYYFIAEDIVSTPNIGSSPNGVVASDVNTVTTHPSSPLTYIVKPTLNGTYTVGSGQNFTTLTAAIDAYNTSCLGGPVVFSLTDASYSSSETFPLTILANADASSTNTLTIKPATGVSPSITGANATNLIRLDGADYIIFDGSNTTSGTTKDLTISNTNTGGSAITLINDASNNTVKNTVVQSVNNNNNTGTIFFSTGVTTGNDSNTIDNCDVRDGATTPWNAIYSQGTTTTVTHNNSGNTVNGCNIFNFFSATGIQAGVNLGLGNTYWTITNNKIYQTATRTFTGAASSIGILIANTNPGSEGFVITGNTIGFASSSGTGVYTITGSANTFSGIDVQINTTPAVISSIQGNIISGVSQTTSASGTGTSSPMTAIKIRSGWWQTGNVTGNIIGDATGASTITVSCSSASTTNEAMGIFNFSSQNTIISNNTVAGITVSNSSGAWKLYGIRANTSSLATNTISNNTVGTTAAPLQNTANNTSSLINGISSEAGIAAVSDNTISNLFVTNGNSSTSTGSTSLVGINQTGTAVSGHVISRNTIHTLENLTTAAVTPFVMGIQYNGPTTGTNLIERNNIHSLSASTGSATLLGIECTAGVVTVQNNMVRLGYTAAGSSITNSNPIIGIRKNGTGNQNYYFNSVYIGGTGVGTVANNTMAFRRNNTGTDVVRGNIFVNERSNASTGGKHYVISTLGTTTLTVNNNVYYYNGTGGLFALNNATDVSAYSAAWLTSDASSREGDPRFINPTGSASTGDLHISTTLSSAAESAAVEISGITSDIDATNSRPAAGYPLSGQTNGGGTNPDAGADEGDFIPGGDTAPPVILYTALTASTCDTGNQTITGVTITDATGLPSSPSLAASTLRPRIYYRKNSGSWFSNAGTYVSGTATNSTWSFTIVTSDMGGVTGNDVVQYYVIAQDASSPANVGSTPATGLVASDVNTVTTAPTTPNSYSVTPTLNGTYTVGASGNYATLDAAIAAYNTNCIGGPVVFSLIDNSYTVSTALTINSNAAASSTNTLTIKPASGVSPTISGTISSAIFVINQADYITIDGSNGSTANTLCPLSQATRDLTIQNNSTSTSSAVIWIQSGGSINTGATNNTIKNVNIIGNSATTTVAGIGCASTTISGASLGIDNDNNRYENNNIQKAQFGIFSQGSGNTNENTGTVITLNQINSGSGNQIGRCGIYIGYDDGAQITGNNIGNISGSSSSIIGIAAGIQTISTTADAGFGAVNVVITDNVINTITSSTVAIAGIAVGAAAETSTTLIQNNMIGGVLYSGTSASQIGTGIYLANKAGNTFNVRNNTIHMFGSLTSTESKNHGITISSNSNNGTTNILNNIFSNTITNTSGKSTCIAIGFGGTAPFSSLNFNYNIFYLNGTNTNIGGYSGLTSGGLLTQSTLSGWQTTIGEDANSVVNPVTFISNTNLHIDTSNGDNFLVNGFATNLSLTSDIDCDTRTAPYDAGADEFDVPNCSTADSGTASASAAFICGSGTVNLTSTGFTLPYTGITYSWESSPNGTTGWTATGGTDPEAFTSATLTADTYFRLVTTCSFGPVVDYSNTVFVEVRPVPTASITTNSPICAGQTLTLTGTTDVGTSFTWTGPNSFASTTQNNSITSATTAASGTYTFVATLNGCSSTTANASVTVNVSPGTPTVTPSSATICAGDDVTLTAAVSGTSFTATQGSGVSTTVGNTTGATLGPNPMQNYYGGEKQQMLFTAAELTALGFSAGSEITAIGFNLAAANTTLALQNYVVKMKNSSLSNLSSSWETGLTTVRTAASYTPVVGLNTLTLTTPFAWDGTSNLVIEVNYSNNNTGGPSAYNTATYDATSFVATRFYRVDTQTAATIDAFVGTPSNTYSSRNRTTFTVNTPLTYSWTPTTGLTPGSGLGASVTAAPTSTTTYTATATNSAGCSSTNTVVVTVNDLPTGAISGTTSICAGSSTNLTLTVTGTGTISGTLSSGDTFSGTAPTITLPVSPTGTTTYTIATLSDANCSAVSGGMTGSATVTVNPLVTPAVSIAASPSSTICAGDNVTFTATPTNGGSTPSYQWYVGASPVGTNSATYSSTSLANGDAVSVVMTSNATCPSPATATSNTVTMTVNAITAVNVSISADVASPICSGTSVTFTATPTGGGTTPSYQWYIGASPVGTNSATFTTTSLTNGNVVSVQMTSNAVCPSPATATSNTLTYTVTAPPTWYQDADNDGYTSGTTLTQCSQPTGYKLITNLVGGVATPVDCNDNNEDVNPGADEWCNGIDDNCVSGIDEGLGTIAYYLDADGDGYGAGTAVIACAQPANHVLNNLDCNDALAGVNPAATEICDGINNDCDAFIDEGCGPINDNKGTALPLTLSNYSVSSCSIFTGTLAGAQPSAEALSTAVTGEDVWYYFTAPSGGVSIQCVSTLNNIMLELQSEEGALIDVENYQSIVGNETLNYGQLTPGASYYLCVRNYNSAQGAGGTFTLCLKNLSSTQCFADPYTLSLCEQFKVSFTGGAQFIYHFGSGITYSGVYSAPPALPASTRIVLNTVPGLTHNMTFPAVWVDAVYALTDGAGNLELVTVNATDSCQLTILPHADLDLRAIDQNVIPSSPITKPINAFIAAEPFICGISSYDWSFRKVDLTGAPTALDSVVVNSGSSSRFIRFNGSTIPGIQPGDRFRVKIRPRFIYAGNPTPVAGDWGTDFQYVRATPAAGMTIQNVDLAYDMLLFEKEIAGENFADIYPNPNNGEAFLINLINLNKGTTTVKVFDSTGKLVYSAQFATEDGLFATTITPKEPLTPGIHLIEITLNNGEVMTKKLVVQ